MDEEDTPPNSLVREREELEKLDCRELLSLFSEYVESDDFTIDSESTKALILNILRSRGYEFLRVDENSDGLIIRNSDGDVVDTIQW